jgi:hypothetical protein
MPRNEVFTFDYPVTDFGKNPAQYVEDLNISAIADIGRDDEILKVHITRITCFDNGRVGTHVHRLIHAIAPIFYKEIEEAAMQHIKGKKEKQVS